MNLVPAPASIPPADRLGRVHLIGIGGAGMSGIARLLLVRGLAVSGSDAQDSPVLGALRALGAQVRVGHGSEHVADADTVVVSSAIRPDNPELVAAGERRLLILPRAAALAALMAGRTGVAVAGTHGKTTTTAMLTVALQAAGRDPSYAIGGDLAGPGSNARHGEDDLFVAEADESDRSFLLLAPQLAIVTNVEPDHLDTYGDAAEVDRAFADFVRRVDRAGVLILCADDPGARRLVPVARQHGLRVVSYGTSPAAAVRVDELVLAGSGSAFELLAEGRRLGGVRLAVPGVHNARNAAAALAAGLNLGKSFSPMAAGLATFTGVHRRFELKGQAGGVRVYDDYAHHPTELRALLTAAREVARPGRLLVAFQPHLYSRTATFAQDFGAALALADEVVVMEVYGAREDPQPGVSGSLVADSVPLPADRVAFEPDSSAVPGRLVAAARPGDLVLTVGAGDVTSLGPQVLALLRTGQG